MPQRCFLGKPLEDDIAHPFQDSIRFQEQRTSRSNPTERKTKDTDLEINGAFKRDVRWLQDIGYRWVTQRDWSDVEGEYRLLQDTQTLQEQVD
jgi:hypothetical protein